MHYTFSEATSAVQNNPKQFLSLVSTLFLSLIPFSNNKWSTSYHFWKVCILWILLSFSSLNTKPNLIVGEISSDGESRVDDSNSTKCFFKKMSSNEPYALKWYKLNNGKSKTLSLQANSSYSSHMWQLVMCNVLKYAALNIVLSQNISEEYIVMKDEIITKHRNG